MVLARLALIPFLLGPVPAIAEVCDKARPRWDPASGPIGPVGEALHLATSPPGIVMLGLAALCLALRSPWAAIPFAVLSGAVIALLEVEWRGDPSGMARAAAREGCQASPILFSGLLALAALAALAASLPLRRG